MKKLSFFLALLFLTFTLDTHAQTRTLTKSEALKVIDSFIKAPVGPKGQIAAAAILQFAEASEDVTIEFTPKAVPWVKEGKSSETSRILLAAWVAGNVRAQIEKKKNANDSYAGELQVLETYKMLKEKNQNLSIPEVEKLIKLEEKGELKKYLRESLNYADKDLA
jgi:hypothetical protein